MDPEEILMKEYEVSTTLIIHLDRQFYETSVFFLVIESAWLGIVINQLSGELVNEKPMQWELLLLLTIVTIFNLLLCYVWFRANRSGREYLRASYDRALEIENEPILKDKLKLYRDQRDRLNLVGLEKHSSNSWEIRVPIIFMIAWTCNLITITLLDSNNIVATILVFIAITIVIVSLKIIEITGWLQGWGIRTPRDK